MKRALHDESETKPARLMRGWPFWEPLWGPLLAVQPWVHNLNHKLFNALTSCCLRATYLNPGFPKNKKKKAKHLPGFLNLPGLLTPLDMDVSKLKVLYVRSEMGASELCFSADWPVKNRQTESHGKTQMPT